MIPTRKGFSFDDVLLVPKKTAVETREKVDIKSYFAKNTEINIPIVSANTPWCTGGRLAAEMARLGGLGIIHRMCSIEEQVAQVRYVKEQESMLSSSSLGDDSRFLVGAAIGINHDYFERANELLGAGANVLVIDIAHGHSAYAIQALKKIRKHFADVKLVAGNVATAEATLDLIEAGADAIKVGIGPGSICTTRVVTGSGIPQITAIHDCSTVARAHNIPIIADGGIKIWGDVAKAIAAGASTVMLGGMLGGVSESVAKLIERNGVKFKVSDGFASLGMKNYRNLKTSGEISRDIKDNYASEGVEYVTPYKGDVREVIGEACAALRSALSYSGSDCIEEFHKKAEFIEITVAGMQESKPHQLDRHKDVYNLSDYKDGVYK